MVRDVDAGNTTDAAPDVNAADVQAADVQAADGGADASMPWKVLADNQEFPDAIAVDETDVYWADAHAGMVLKCSKGGCNDKPTVLASSQWGMWTIALSGTNVYWNTVPDPGPNDAPGPIMTCAKSGCGGNPSFAVTKAWPFSMVSDGTNLYWTDKSGQVLKCAPGCTSPVVIASSQNDPVSVAIDKANLYWANDGSGTIMKCALAGCGGSPSVIVSSVVGPYGIAVNASSVFWATGTQLLACDLGACTAPTVIAADTTVSAEPDVIAADDQSIYWGSWVYGVRTCPVTGCGALSPAVIGSTKNVEAVAIDATDVYWGTGNSGVSDAVDMAPK